MSSKYNVIWRVCRGILVKLWRCILVALFMILAMYLIDKYIAIVPNVFVVSINVAERTVSINLIREVIYSSLLYGAVTYLFGRRFSLIELIAYNIFCPLAAFLSKLIKVL